MDAPDDSDVPTDTDAPAEVLNDEADPTDTQLIPEEEAEFDDTDDEAEEMEYLDDFSESGSVTSSFLTNDQEYTLPTESFNTIATALADTPTEVSVDDNSPSQDRHSPQIVTHEEAQNTINISAVPKQTKFFKEAVPVDDYGPALLIRETIDNHKHLRQRLRDFDKVNINNDQVLLFFVGTADKNGRSWHANSNLVEKALSFLLKKLRFGGFLLKVHVGQRNEWLDPDNPYRRDPKLQILDIPTLWVWGTSKKIFGKKCFDIESLYLILKD